MERSSYPGLVIHTLSSLGHELPIRLHVSLLKDGSIQGQNVRVDKNWPVGSSPQICASIGHREVAHGFVSLDSGSTSIELGLESGLP